MQDSQPTPGPRPAPGGRPNPGTHMPTTGGGTDASGQQTQDGAHTPVPHSPEAAAETLASDIDELLSQRLEGTEEAAMLEQAHSLISKALGQG